MTIRSILLATALLAAIAHGRLGPDSDDVIAAPVLRASVTVSGDVVRIGDVIDNAGTAAQIAIYRAPDLGTTGTLPTAQVDPTLRAHQVIGVDTRELKEISVTRLARTLDGKDIELQVARALEHRNGLGEAANLSLTFDRDVQDMQAGCLEQRRDAGGRRPGSSRATAASTSLSRSPTTTSPRRRGCASPAPRSRPSRPRCWRAASNAMR